MKFFESNQCKLTQPTLYGIYTVPKNAIASQVVVLVRKFPEPLDPKIVAEEPAPKDAPRSAPLPC